MPIQGVETNESSRFIDHTLATPWEEFVAEIEKAIRSYCKTAGDKKVSKTEIIYQGLSYRLEKRKSGAKRVSDGTSRNTSALRREALYDSTWLHQTYGIGCQWFLLFSNGTSSAEYSASLRTTVLSAFATALRSCELVPLPVFFTYSYVSDIGNVKELLGYQQILTIAPASKTQRSFDVAHDQYSSQEHALPMQQRLAFKPANRMIWYRYESYLSNQIHDQHPLFFFDGIRKIYQKRIAQIYPTLRNQELFHVSAMFSYSLKRWAIERIAARNLSVVAPYQFSALSDPFMQFLKSVRSKADLSNFLLLSDVQVELRHGEQIQSSIIDNSNYSTYSHAKVAPFNWSVTTNFTRVAIVQEQDSIRSDPLHSMTEKGSDMPLASRYVALGQGSATPTAPTAPIDKVNSSAHIPTEWMAGCVRKLLAFYIFSIFCDEKGINIEKLSYDIFVTGDVVEQSTLDRMIEALSSDSREAFSVLCKVQLGRGKGRRRSSGGFASAPAPAPATSSSGPGSGSVGGGGLGGDRTSRGSLYTGSGNTNSMTAGAVSSSGSSYTNSNGQQGIPASLSLATRNPPPTASAALVNAILSTYDDDEDWTDIQDPNDNLKDICDFLFHVAGRTPSRTPTTPNYYSGTAADNTNGMSDMSVEIGSAGEVPSSSQTIPPQSPIPDAENARRLHGRLPPLPLPRSPSTSSSLFLADPRRFSNIASKANFPMTVGPESLGTNDDRGEEHDGKPSPPSQQQKQQVEIEDAPSEGFDSCRQRNIGYWMSLCSIICGTAAGDANSIARIWNRSMRSLHNAWESEDTLHDFVEENHPHVRNRSGSSSGGVSGGVSDADDGGEGSAFSGGVPSSSSGGGLVPLCCQPLWQDLLGQQASNSTVVASNRFGIPDLNDSIIVQKLQMVQFCMHMRHKEVTTRSLQAFTSPLTAQDSSLDTAATTSASEYSSYAPAAGDAGRRCEQGEGRGEGREDDMGGDGTWTPVVVPELFRRLPLTSDTIAMHQHIARKSFAQESMSTAAVAAAVATADADGGADARGSASSESGGNSILQSLQNSCDSSAGAINYDTCCHTEPLHPPQTRQSVQSSVPLLPKRMSHCIHEDAPLDGGVVPRPSLHWQLHLAVISSDLMAFKHANPDKDLKSFCRWYGFVLAPAAEKQLPDEAVADGTATSATGTGADAVGGGGTAAAAAAAVKDVPRAVIALQEEAEEPKQQDSQAEREGGKWQGEDKNAERSLAQGVEGVESSKDPEGSIHDEEEANEPKTAAQADDETKESILYSSSTHSAYSSGAQPNSTLQQQQQQQLVVANLGGMPFSKLEELWRDLPALPCAEQSKKPFSAEKEAEKAIGFLERVKASDLSLELLASAMQFLSIALEHQVQSWIAELAHVIEKSSVKEGARKSNENEGYTAVRSGSGGAGGGAGGGPILDMCAVDDCSYCITLQSLRAQLQGDVSLMREQALSAVGQLRRLQKTRRMDSSYFRRSRSRAFSTTSESTVTSAATSPHPTAGTAATANATLSAEAGVGEKDVAGSNSSATGGAEGFFSASSTLAGREEQYAPISLLMLIDSVAGLMEKLEACCLKVESVRKLLLASKEVPLDVMVLSLALRDTYAVQSEQEMHALTDLIRGVRTNFDHPPQLQQQRNSNGDSSEHTHDQQQHNHGAVGNGGTRGLKAGQQGFQWHSHDGRLLGNPSKKVFTCKLGRPVPASSAQSSSAAAAAAAAASMGAASTNSNGCMDGTGRNSGSTAPSTTIPIIAPNILQMDAAVETERLRVTFRVAEQD